LGHTTTRTGRTGLFPSYESFLGIVTTMIEQYAKFLKMAVETKWRGPVASLNYIESSTLWRQEHNGYSHQNPGLIGSFLGLPRHCARIYLPAEANSSVSVMAHCLRSKNYVNLIVGSKNPTQAWLSTEEAERHCVAGASVWEKYSTDKGLNPDVVLVGLGVEVTMEVIAASALLRNEGVRVRVVNVVDMMILGEEGKHPHALTVDAFESLFTNDKPGGLMDQRAVAIACPLEADPANDPPQSCSTSTVIRKTLPRCSSCASLTSAENESTSLDVSVACGERQG
jgi:xylulose-5-phosphate/fructose-6-phosphate phosphoketolase